MKHKGFDALIFIIFVLSIASCLIGLFSTGGVGQQYIETFLNQTVTLHGVGLYQYDSLSVASQGLAQDVVTLIVACPMLIISWMLSKKGSLKATLLLLGTLGYFLYTYVSYVFLWMLNPLFIVYVILMSSSFFAFTWLFSLIDLKKLANQFKSSLPVKTLGIIQISLGLMLILMWGSMIFQYMVSREIPTGLDHYTTLVIQGLDLGFIVPVSILSGTLLLKGKSLGYLLSSVVITKGFTMGLAIVAMLIGQTIVGVSIGIGEYAAFTIFSVLLMISLVLLLRSIENVEVETVLK